MEALASLADASTTEGGAVVRFEAEGGARRLPARIEAGVFRIAQEALANALGHADASTITLHLTIGVESLVLRIEDDGRGFEPGAIPADRFGLVGLSERARLLGGSLRVESAPGAGTRVEAVVPLA